MSMWNYKFTLDHDKGSTCVNVDGMFELISHMKVAKSVNVCFLTEFHYLKNASKSLNDWFEPLPTVMFYQDQHFNQPDQI